MDTQMEKFFDVYMLLVYGTYSKSQNKFEALWLSVKIYLIIGVKNRVLCFEIVSGTLNNR